MVSIVGVSVGFAMLGCSSNMSTENTLLKNENEELRMQYKESTVALQAADADFQRMQDNLRASQEKNTQLQSVLDTRPETINYFKEIDGVDVSMRNKDLALTVASDLLFNSGSATLKNSANKTLAAVASGLNSTYPDKTIVIMGYTDTDTIKKSNYKSNWHLAFDRAWSVREFLVLSGIDRNRIAIESWGPTRPLTTKAASRRVDIVVVSE
jgi:chemotaxis protein MotB